MSVAPDELTGTEQAVLLVLMAESRPVPNPELERLGPRLDKLSRDRLNRLGLIETTPGRPLVHDLTDSGWALCRQLFGADPPLRASAPGRTLYTLLKALRRHFDGNDLVPADVFLPATPEATQPAPADPEGLVRAAYHRLSPKPGAWVGLARLRDEVADLPPEDIDAVLVNLYRQPGVSLIPEENQKVLTEADRAAAVRIGDQNKHLIAIES